MGELLTVLKQENDMVKFVFWKAPLTAVWKVDLNWKNLFTCLQTPHEGLSYWLEKRSHLPMLDNLIP